MQPDNTEFTKEQVLAHAGEIHRMRYADALFCVASGSIIEGHGTVGSDLDLVVIYEKLDFAYRESFIHEGLPVEAFVHDPDTLQAFIDGDHKSAHAAMFHMMATGIVVPQDSELSEKLRAYSRMKFETGAPVLGREQLDALRYSVSDLIDDLKGVRPASEQRAILYALYEKMGELHLRRQNKFYATGKRLARQLAESDPVLLKTLDNIMTEAHQSGVKSSHIAAFTRMLDAMGGHLFDGYYRAAPRDMRKKAEWL